MTFRVRAIIRIAFGGSLALVALFIGVRSLADLIVPTGGFAPIDHVAFASSSAQLPPAAHTAVKKKVTVKKKEVLAAAPAQVAPTPGPAFIQPDPTPVLGLPAITSPPILNPPVPPLSAPAQSTASSTHELAQPPVVLISEVSAGSELSSNDEFIELYNAGQQSVDLTGWYINKKTASGKEEGLVAKARLQNKIIGAGKYFVIVHDGGVVGVAPDALWAKSNGIAAKKNGVALYDAAGVKVDETSWQEIPKASSYVRVPLMEGASFRVQNVLTPGS